ncbi:iron-sulfur cluster-binding domain-containing protein [Pontibacter sp. BT327]|uniref:Iron-sulfur cluster-binding domain-containing protein n=1 Tax=Pontibacter burrus TaxID=2704466 RepID=A0A6B3LP48_9BACT|nr:iron-sulfur cluster-binding domain-containing protein [Pontibacter burrus]
MSDKSAETTRGYQTLTISNISEEVAGVKIFTFNETISYKAGQYLTLLHHGPHGEIRRSYSITSSPVLNEPLAIGVKRIENGFYSRRLVDQAKVGDKLLTSGAGGLFTFPDDIQNYKQVFLLAAGSGITPVYSLLKTALHTYPHLSVVLFYSNKSPEQTIFLQPLQQLASAFPDRLHIEFVYSNSPDLGRARLHKDYLYKLIEKLAIAPHDQLLFYLCGPLNYMRLSSFSLRQFGFSANQIRKEVFNVDKTPLPKVVPPDTRAHKVTLHINGKVSQIRCKYPQNILASARDAGIAIPYSCETGKCGSCLAKVIKGDVWMAYNEVLTENDLQKGLTLTCVGYPVGGDAELEIL